jgi:hypothetical protein
MRVCTCVVLILHFFCRRAQSCQAHCTRPCVVLTHADGPIACRVHVSLSTPPNASACGRIRKSIPRPAPGEECAVRLHAARIQVADRIQTAPSNFVTCRHDLHCFHILLSAPFYSSFPDTLTKAETLSRPPNHSTRQCAQRHLYIAALPVTRAACTLLPTLSYAWLSS